MGEEFKEELSKRVRQVNILTLAPSTLIFRGSVQVQEGVRREVELQVQQAVGEAITQYIPVSMGEQMENNKRQIRDVKIALQNS